MDDTTALRFEHNSGKWDCRQSDGDLLKELVKGVSLFGYETCFPDCP